MYEYQCHLLRVVDADTLHLEVDLGLDVRIRITGRLRGVDTPELHTVEGKAARNFVTAWVERAGGGPFVVRTTKDRREKFGRYLVDLYNADGGSLTADLLVAGHARIYDGGHR